jgi:orotate phosphoribosyltransferase
MDKAQLASAIAAVSSLSGEFTLRSGAMATEYFDKYRFEGDPTLLRAIAEHLEALIPPETDALAGLELGGVPLATALSLRTGLPVVFVRKQAKEAGVIESAVSEVAETTPAEVEPVGARRMPGWSSSCALSLVVLAKRGLALPRDARPATPTGAVP